ncbi:hypothetical protein QEH59_09955 [Coraliomargarita sp. SDUM461004]|uniref:PEP-CTERM sorting domain-containing protein n=1 Tax=Thalassobacterium sedimentorum TaxID=3041258 RepID=A0ABU1AJC8_9BACT|nr:hypothetical protein [Coraliomargarita sp. SDUM461004]MDQ8194749.1 hypothetical protein [Coraliomargarita sp. SDUM461004]
MKNYTRTLLVASAVFLSSLIAHADVWEDFDSLNNWNAYSAEEGALTPTVVSDAGEKYLKMETEYTATTGLDRIGRIVTKVTYDDLNFATSAEPVSLAFEDVSLVNTGRPGYLFIGLTTDGGSANLYNRTNSIYFQQVGDDEAYLVLRDGGTGGSGTQALWSTNDSSKLSYDYSTISLVLTDTTWALGLYDASGSELLNESGSMTVSSSNWADGVYMSMTWQQSSNGSATSMFTMDSISLIPEPSGASLWMGVGCMFVIGMSGIRRRA